MQVSRVADILIKAQLLDNLQARSAMARQAQWGGRLSKHIVELGFAEEDAISEALARALGLQRVDLGAIARDPGALAKVDVKTAEEKGVFPYALRDNGKTLYVAMADPSDLEVVDFVAARSGCRVRPAVAGEREILVAIYRHYRNQVPPASLLGLDDRRPSAGQLGAMDLSDATGVPRAVTQTPAMAVRPASPPPRPPTPARVSPSVSPNTASLRLELPADVIATLPPAVSDYLLRLNADLEKTTRVLRGLIEVCVAKQLFSSDEIRTAIARVGAKPPG
jgi:hypothetical protein